MKTVTDKMIQEYVDELGKKLGRSFGWFLTGSCFFNDMIIDDKSDIDIVVDVEITEEDLRKINNKLEDEDDEYSKCYFQLNDYPILNIISKPKQDDWDLWRKATEVVKYLYQTKEHISSRKDIRIDVFKKIVYADNFSLTKFRLKHVGE